MQLRDNLDGYHQSINYYDRELLGTLYDFYLNVLT